MLAERLAERLAQALFQCRVPITEGVVDGHVDPTSAINELRRVVSRSADQMPSGPNWSCTYWSRVGSS